MKRLFAVKSSDRNKSSVVFSPSEALVIVHIPRARAAFTQQRSRA
jgi:hypothetical protein